MGLDHTDKSGGRRKGADAVAGSDSQFGRGSNAESNHFESLAERAIVLTGPTASGKSAVAMELAEQLDAELVSLDSIAVYRRMDIGTAKPSPADRQRVNHHLIDLVDPTETFSVACYLDAAHEAIDRLERRGRPAVFVGGTPMYLKGILRGFDPGPPADWEFRRSVEEDVRLHGVEALRRRLQQVDPLAAHRIDANDTRRMIRALEVARHTGLPISHRQTQFENGRSATQCRAFALQVPRDQLHQRINGRVNQMFDSGLVDEVRQLLDRFGELSRTASQAVGYREVIDWIRDGGDFEEMKESVAAHTRRLARRQETWFRSFTELTYVAAPDGTQPRTRQSKSFAISRHRRRRIEIWHRVGIRQPQRALADSTGAAAEVGLKGQPPPP